jgi:hypothetical protein
MRNVLIYFDAASRAGVIERLLDHLAPTGCLLSVTPESLAAMSEQSALRRDRLPPRRLEPLRPYRRRDWEGGPTDEHV